MKDEIALCDNRLNQGGLKKLRRVVRRELLGNEVATVNRNLTSQELKTRDNKVSFSVVKHSWTLTPFQQELTLTSDVQSGG